jgi:hypothetical protein
VRAALAAGIGSVVQYTARCKPWVVVWGCTCAVCVQSFPGFGLVASEPPDV